jgi:flagellar motor protein MotB
MMTTRPRRKADEAEKPFWISYADLMTSLMVLFLVAMSVALIAVSKEIADQYRDTKRCLEASTHARQGFGKD